MSLLVLSCFKPRACCSAASSGLRGPQSPRAPAGAAFQVSLVILQSAYDMAVVRDGCPSRGRLHRASSSASVPSTNPLSRGSRPSRQRASYGTRRSVTGACARASSRRIGLANVWGSGDRSLGSATWTDERCRTITVALAVPVGALPPGPRLGEWVVTTNAAGQCGNGVLGDARCLRYAARADNITL